MNVNDPPVSIMKSSTGSGRHPHLHHPRSQEQGQKEAHYRTMDGSGSSTVSSSSMSPDRSFLASGVAMSSSSASSTLPPMHNMMMTMMNVPPQQPNGGGGGRNVNVDGGSETSFFASVAQPLQRRHHQEMMGMMTGKPYTPDDLFQTPTSPAHTKIQIKASLSSCNNTNKNPFKKRAAGSLSPKAKKSRKRMHSEDASSSSPCTTKKNDPVVNKSNSSKRRRSSTDSHSNDNEARIQQNMPAFGATTKAPFTVPSSSNDTSESSGDDINPIDDRSAFSATPDDLGVAQEDEEEYGTDNKVVIVQGDRKTPGAHIRMRLLPADFEPSERDVLCGRGRICKMAQGNIAYRKLVESKLDIYAAAKTKLEKGAILSDIVDAIRLSSPQGGFVKQDAETGRWYEVGDFLAREKTSQCFRDALHDQYSSSAQAKYKRRKAAEVVVPTKMGSGDDGSSVTAGSVSRTTTTIASPAMQLQQQQQQQSGVSQNPSASSTSNSTVTTSTATTATASNATGMMYKNPIAASIAAPPLSPSPMASPSRLRSGHAFPTLLQTMTSSSSASSLGSSVAGGGGGGGLYAAPAGAGAGGGTTFEQKKQQQQQQRQQQQQYNLQQNRNQCLPQQPAGFMMNNANLLRYGHAMNHHHHTHHLMRGSSDGGGGGGGMGMVRGMGLHPNQAFTQQALLQQQQQQQHLVNRHHHGITGGGTMEASGILSSPSSFEDSTLYGAPASLVGQLPFLPNEQDRNGRLPRRPSENAVASVLQQMATASGGTDAGSSSDRHGSQSELSQSTSLSTSRSYSNTQATGLTPGFASTNRTMGGPKMAVASQQLKSHEPPRDEIKVCTLQLQLRQASETPLDATQRTLVSMEAVAASAASDGGAVDLFVLPELSPVGYSEDTFARFLPTTPAMQNMYQQIDQAFAAEARKLNAYICYGTIGWKETSDDDGTNQGNGTQSLRFTIRQVVVNREGNRVVCYDKIYLCDYGACAETRFFTPGSKQPVSFSVDGFRFGMMICADMRYPQLSRTLGRDHNVDVLLQPAAFYRDCSFRTWQSFRETRAVENACYFVSVNYAGDSYGSSAVVPPWVDDTHEPLVLGTVEGYLVGRIQRSELDHVRSTMPFYKALLEEKEAARTSTSTSTTTLPKQDTE